MATVSIQREPFDERTESARLTAGRADIGAVVAFTGICRDEDGRLSALELEHYPGMAGDEIARIARQTEERFALKGLTVIHRHGRLTPGEPIVLVVTAASHRRAALQAAEYLMDYLKTRAPFWKKEHLSDGTTGNWVDAAESDDRDAARWERDSD
ncbi:MAG: molybdenum cofactor biosynthesis protein MoaE [Flavobacteriaceae bacterium]